MRCTMDCATASSPEARRRRASHRHRLRVLHGCDANGPQAARLPLSVLFLVAALGFGSVFTAGAAEAFTLDIQADQPGARVNPAMWGVFFEDINFGADGGLYAELVKNRSFEFPDPLMGWKKVEKPGCSGSMAIRNEHPFNPANPNYLRVAADSNTGFALSNEGFRGMGIREGETYDFSAWIRRAAGHPKSIVIELIGENNSVLASANLRSFGSTWRQQRVGLTAKATDPKARLNILLTGEGALDLDMVSLFSRHTWKNRRGGLRADLVQMLADLKPGFVRFPGGCIVEGYYLTNRYQWKTTLGLPESRKLIINRWNDEFKHRPAPDYFQSFGLGFFEFFQLCEDIGAEPLPILNCGMACQFNSSELAGPAELPSYVQDALDLVEFANGPATSPWGSRRAAMGHPKPFNMKLLGVGNEQWGPAYFERYAQFAKALKDRYPKLQLISSAGPAPGDERFKSAWSRLRELNADIIDEHCYDKPAWFLNNFGRYDAYERTGPKVFMGEYAAQSVSVGSPNNRNTLECALAEGAYMLGMERNADVVRMSSYAPLFAHIEGWQWTPDLIWCDNLHVYGTPSYYVQQLFSRNPGDIVLPAKVSVANGQNPEAGNRIYASSTKDEQSGDIIIKIVNPSVAAISLPINISGLTPAPRPATATVLAGTAPGDENSFAMPQKISPSTSPLGKIAPRFTYDLKPYSMTVLRLQARK